MSSARKTLKILALVYFVLGIASLVIAGVGIATGNLDSTYGSNAMLAAVVLVAKGLIDLIEHPKTTLLDRIVIPGSLRVRESVAKLR